jgi:hypothetical protein
VLLTESPVGGSGLVGHAHTNAERGAATRTQNADLTTTRGPDTGKDEANVDGDGAGIP